MPTAGFTQPASDVADRPYAGGEPNRLPEEVQRELIAPAMEHLNAGDIRGAKAAFEAQVLDVARHKGASSLDVADLITAFAVQLYRVDRLDDALPYFRATVEAYRQARGPDHPDVAVAEQDYSRMLVEKNPDDPPVEAVSVLEDAYRIRANRLGMVDAETAVNLSILGKLKGHPKFTGGDPARIEAAADLIRQAIVLLPQCHNRLAEDLPNARYRLAELYARNDRVLETLRAFDAYLKADREDAKDAADDIAAILAEHGHDEAAKAVAQLRPLEPV